jgi:hypothetical protein
VLANRESARQTILRRQAIRDELARKVADLSSQNENMKKVRAYGENYRNQLAICSMMITTARTSS